MDGKAREKMQDFRILSVQNNPGYSGYPRMCPVIAFMPWTRKT
jgi:hypothetical protein